MEITLLPHDPASRAIPAPISLGQPQSPGSGVGSRETLKSVRLMLYISSHLILAHTLQYGVSLYQRQKLRTGEAQEPAQGARSLCRWNLKPGGRVVKFFFLDQVPEFRSSPMCTPLPLTKPGALWSPASIGWRKQVPLHVLLGECSSHSLLSVPAPAIRKWVYLSSLPTGCQGKVPGNLLTHSALLSAPH